MPEISKSSTRGAAAKRSAHGKAARSAALDTQQAARDAAVDKLPPLTSPEDALARLDAIALLALRQTVAGAGANAAAQATRTWLDGYRVAIAASRVKELERELARLTDENRQLRARVAERAP